MNPLHFCIAVTPFSVYLLLLGYLNLRRKPFVTTRGRDIAILGFAISGLVMIGPMELFFPETAVARFGPFVWVMLLAFYGLCVSMIALTIRPGLVVYNSTYDQFRPVLADALAKLDKAQWMGDNVRLPQAELHFHVESNPWLYNIELVSSGRRQSLNSWRELELGLSHSIDSMKTRPNLYGPVLLSAGLVLTITSWVWMWLQQEQVVTAFQQMMRL